MGRKAGWSEAAPPRGLHEGLELMTGGLGGQALSPQLLLPIQQDVERRFRCALSTGLVIL